MRARKNHLTLAILTIFLFLILINSVSADVSQSHTQFKFNDAYTNTGTSTASLVDAGSGNSFTTGKIGNAYNSTGAGYVQNTTISLTTGNHNIYISSWFKTTTSDTGTIKYWGMIGDDGSAQGNYVLSITNNKIGAVIGAGGAVAGNFTLTANTWYFVEITYTASNKQSNISINRVEAGTGTHISNLNMANNYISVGGNKGVSGFNAIIDDFRYYETIPTPSQRDEIYNGGVGTESNPITTPTGIVPNVTFQGQTPSNGSVQYQPTNNNFTVNTTASNLNFTQTNVGKHFLYDSLFNLIMQNNDTTSPANMTSQFLGLNAGTYYYNASVTGQVNVSLNTTDPSLLLYQNFSNINYATNTTIDGSTYANNGTLVGYTFNHGTRVGGQSGATFDGVNDYMNMSTVNVSSGTLTICSWFSRVEPEVQIVISQGNATGSTQQSFITYIGADHRPVVRYSNGTSALTTTATNLISTSSVNKVCHVLNGTHQLIYLNNTLESSNLSFTGGIYQVGNLRIGINGNSASNPFNGSIYKETIYTRALSLSEMLLETANDYVLPSPVGDGLVAQYILNDSRFSNSSHVFDVNNLVSCSSCSSGLAERFNGSQYVSLPNNAFDGLSVGSIFGRIKPHSLSTNYIFSYGDSASTNKYLSFAFSSSGGGIITFAVRNASASNQVTLSGLGVVSLNEEHSVAIVHNGTNYSMYVDGVPYSYSMTLTGLNDSVLWFDDIASSAELGCIGVLCRSSLSSYSTSPLSDVIVINRSLSASEVLQLHLGYYNDSVGSETRTIHIYNLSQYGINNTGTISSQFVNLTWNATLPNPDAAGVSIVNYTLTLLNSSLGFNDTLNLGQNNNLTYYYWNVYAENLSTGIYYFNLTTLDTRGNRVSQTSRFNLTKNALLNITAKYWYDNSTINNFNINLTDTLTGELITNVTSTGRAWLDVIRGHNYSTTITSTNYSSNTTTITINNVPIQNYTFIVYRYNSVNIYFYNEETGALINDTTVFLDLISDIQSGSYNTTTGILIVDLLYPTTYQARYYASGFSERFYSFTISEDTSQTINLYLRNLSETVLIQVRDISITPIEGAIVKIQKKIPSTNEFITVEIVTTDINGESTASLTLNDEWYRALVYVNGELVLITEPAYILSSPWILTISTTTGGDDVFNYLDITGDVTFNNVTNVFSFDFDDPNNVQRSYCLNINNNNNVTLVSSCTTSDSGTITQAITPVNGTTYNAIGYVEISSVYLPLDEESVSFEEYPADMGSLGMLGFFVITLVLVLIGLKWPEIIPMMPGLGLELTKWAGLISLDWWACNLVLFCGFIIMIWISRHRNS